MLQVGLKCGVKVFRIIMLRRRRSGYILHNIPIFSFQQKQKQISDFSIDKTVAKLLPPSLNGYNLKQEMFHLCPDLNINAGK